MNKIRSTDVKSVNRHKCRPSTSVFRGSYKSQEELLDEIIDLKRQFTSMKDENQMQKVKLRKMTDEMSKKDHLIEHLMDPKKNSEMRRVISDKGAILILNLKDQNERLEHTLIEKDVHIRRLQNNIRVTRLYAYKTRADTYMQEIFRLKNQLSKYQSGISKVPLTTTNIKKLRYSSPGSPTSPTQSICSNLTIEKEILVRENESLQKEIESLKYEFEQMLTVEPDIKEKYNNCDKIYLLYIIENLQKALQGHKAEETIGNHSVQCDTAHGLNTLDQVAEEPELLINELESTIKELTGETSVLRNLVTNLNKEISLLKEQLAEKEKKIKNLMDKLDSPESSVENNDIPPEHRTTNHQSSLTENMISSLRKTSELQEMSLDPANQIISMAIVSPRKISSEFTNLETQPLESLILQLEETSLSVHVEPPNTSQPKTVSWNQLHELPQEHQHQPSKDLTHLHAVLQYQLSTSAMDETETLEKLKMETHKPPESPSRQENCKVTRMEPRHPKYLPKTPLIKETDEKLKLPEIITLKDVSYNSVDSDDDVVVG